jgi:hypothetical protein
VIDLDDFKLERSEEAPLALPPPRSNNNAVWGAAAIVVGLVVGGGIWFTTTSQRQPSSPRAAAVPTTPPATVPEAERPEVPLVEAANIDLPSLRDTDPIVRELVARLSSHPTIAAWLATKGLIANFTVVTLTIAEGRGPTQFLRPIAPRGRFRTTGSGAQLFVDPRSYDRYNAHADAIAALDPVGTASLYLTLKPRISDAYRELGHPQSDFDRVLERAIGVLLQTPELDGTVALHPKGLTYAYTNPTLESLSPAQKQLLRLGPRNGALVRGKLEEIAALLKLKSGVPTF